MAETRDAEYEFLYRGAAKGPSAAVTFLGALNTVVAGILTYLKGQGLPGRLEQYLHLLRTLREHIEEREREFAEPDCALDVDEVVQSIVQMYKEVRQTAEDNAPGNVLPPKGAIASLMVSSFRSFGAFFVHRAEAEMHSLARSLL